MTARIIRNPVEGILALPSELLNNIFHYLNPMTLEKMSVVCFAWNEHLKAQQLVLLKGIISKKFDISRTSLNMITTITAAKEINAQLNQEKKNAQVLLKIENEKQSEAITKKICLSQKLTDEMLEAYLQEYPQADAFSVKPSSSFIITDEMLAVCARKWTQLKTFELKASLLAFAFPTRIAVQSILNIIEKCNIFSLTLEDRNLSKEDFQKIFSLTQGLQKCKLSNPQVDDETIETLLLNNPHLRSLELWACGRLTDKTLNNISEYGAKMRKVRFSVEAAFSQKAVCAMLKSLPKLENFDFYGNLSDQDVLAIAAAVPKIKMLTLEEWKVSKVSTVVTVGKLCPHLELLDFEVKKPKKRLSSPTTIFFKLEKSLGNAINTHREHFKNLQSCYVNLDEVYTNEKLS